MGAGSSQSFAPRKLKEESSYVDFINMAGIGNV